MRLRAATARDLPFLWEMLTYAARMEPGGASCVAAAQNDPLLAFYLDGFPRPGELGVLAEDDAPLGAAWLRTLVGPPVSAHVATVKAPELAIATVPTRRGGGVGLALLRALLSAADAIHAETVLSVRVDNPSVRLYLRVGYRVDGELINRVGTRSWRMRRVRGC